MHKQATKNRKHAIYWACVGFTVLVAREYQSFAAFTQ